jgi:hypothetical protein
MAINSIALGAVTVDQLPCRFLFMANASLAAQCSIGKHKAACQQQEDFSGKSKDKCRH